jgi:hypothetical protein
MTEEEVINKSREEESSKLAVSDATDAIKEVEEVRDAIEAHVSETTLPDRVADISTMLDNLSEEVDSWKTWHKTDYLGALESIKSEVNEIQTEWNAVSGSVTLLKDKLEALLQSVPGVIETSTLKALTMRVDHLEKLLAQVVSESQAKESVRGARRQFIISIIALGITIILWGVFIVINFLK